MYVNAKACAPFALPFCCGVPGLLRLRLTGSEHGLNHLSLLESAEPWASN